LKKGGKGEVPDASRDTRHPRWLLTVKQPPVSVVDPATVPVSARSGRKAGYRQGTLAR
jgi:hypothetical protein